MIQLSAEEFEQLSQYCKPYGLVLTEEAISKPEAKEAALRLLQSELRRVRRKVLLTMGGVSAATAAAAAAATAATGPIGAAAGTGAVGAQVVGLTAFAAFSATATATAATATVWAALAGILAAIPAWIWASVVAALAVAISWAIAKADLVHIGWSQTPGPHGPAQTIGIRIKRTPDAPATVTS